MHSADHAAYLVERHIFVTRNPAPRCRGHSWRMYGANAIWTRDYNRRLVAADRRNQLYRKPRISYDFDCTLLPWAEGAAVSAALQGNPPRDPLVIFHFSATQRPSPERIFVGWKRRSSPDPYAMPKPRRNLERPKVRSQRLGD